MDTTIRSALKNCVERNSQNSKSSSDGPFQALFHFSELTDTSANGYESICIYIYIYIRERERERAVCFLSQDDQ